MVARLNLLRLQKQAAYGIYRRRPDKDLPLQKNNHSFCGKKTALLIDSIYNSPPGRQFPGKRK